MTTAPQPARVVTLPNGEVLTPEEFRAKQASDLSPAAKAYVARQIEHTHAALAEILDEERDITRKEMRESLADLSGLEALRGGARVILSENARAISKACQDPLNRKPVILNGDPPAWALELFT